MSKLNAPKITVFLAVLSVVTLLGFLITTDDQQKGAALEKEQQSETASARVASARGHGADYDCGNCSFCDQNKGTSVSSPTRSIRTKPKIDRAKVLADTKPLQAWLQTWEKDAQTQRKVSNSPLPISNRYKS